MTESSLQASPLAHEHERAGARMTDFAGWSMPLRYSGDLAEHRAVRTGAGLFDLSHMAQLDVSGPQAAQALDYALVSEVSRLKVGRARYTMLVRGDGGIVDDLIVYRLSATEFLVIANAANRLSVLDAITSRSEGFEAAIIDRTSHRALIALQGPQAAEILGSVLPVDLAEVKYYSATVTSLGTVPVLLARTGYTGEDGFELSIPADAAPEVWSALREAGDVELCGLAARDSLRLEAGMPLYGQELTTDVTPFEVGLEWVVHTDREFVGDVALTDRKTNGPRAHLIGLAGTGRRAARSGYRVLDGDDAVGEVTSGVLSPTLGHPIAMALVSRPYEPGQRLGVDVRGSVQPMDVVELPFYRRPT